MTGPVELKRCDHGRAELSAILRAWDKPCGLADRGPLQGRAYLPLHRGRDGIQLLCAQAVPGRSKVVMPSFLCAAVCQAAIAAGMSVDFCDIQDDLNIDIEDARRVCDDSTAWVVVPHMAGKPADMAKAERLLRPAGVRLLDDAACCFGILHEGEYLGTKGDAGIYSFAQQKSLVAGFGGALVANSDTGKALLAKLAPAQPGEFACAARTLLWAWEYRYRGLLPTARYYVNRLLARLRGPAGAGPHVPSSMAKVTARVLGVQLERADAVLAARQANCRALYERLRGLADVQIPQYYNGCILTKFFLRTPGLKWRFDENGLRPQHPLASYLARKGVETAPGYRPLHWMKAFQGPGRERRPLPKTEAIAPELLALPVQGKMTESDYDRIGQAVASFFGGNHA